MSDSRTSRILARSAGGTATEFTFAAGAGLPEHSTAHQALVIVAEGELRVTLGGETRTVRAGETISFPPDAPHAVHAPSAARMILVLLRTDV